MDDSEPARAALEHALTVVHADRITVVHAIDDLEAGYGGGPTAGEGAEPEFFEDAKAIARERDSSATVATEVVEGTAADAILEFADEADVDGIVIGSEGRSGAARVLLGSVAERVARESTVPVTIVPRPAAESV